MTKKIPKNGHATGKSSAKKQQVNKFQLIGEGDESDTSSVRDYMRRPPREQFHVERTIALQDSVADIVDFPASVICTEYRKAQEAKKAKAKQGHQEPDKKKGAERFIVHHHPLENVACQENILFSRLLSNILQGNYQPLDATRPATDRIEHYRRSATYMSDTAADLAELEESYFNSALAGKNKEMAARLTETFCLSALSFAQEAFRRCNIRPREEVSEISEIKGRPAEKFIDLD